MKRIWLIFPVMLLAIGVASAQTSTPQLTNDPVFQKNCAKCHGKTARGRHFAGPSLVSGGVSTMTEDEIRGVITNGKHRTPKFGSKLSSDEINTLVTEIKSSSRP